MDKPRIDIKLSHGHYICKFFIYTDSARYCSIDFMKNFILDLARSNTKFEVLRNHSSKATLRVTNFPSSWRGKGTVGNFSNGGSTGKIKEFSWLHSNNFSITSSAYMEILLGLVYLPGNGNIKEFESCDFSVECLPQVILTVKTLEHLIRLVKTKGENL